MIMQILLSIAFLANLWLVSRRRKQGAVSGAVAFLWAIGAFAGLIVTWYPQTTSYIANVFGVGRGADLVVYLAVVLLFGLVFQLYVSHVRLERELTKIVRDESLKDI